VEEPLEGEETDHRDGEDEQAEWVHGHPTTLRERRRLRLVLEVVTRYKYLGIWLDDCLSFKRQVNNLLRKLWVKLGFFFRNKSCFSLEARKRLVSVTF